MDDDTGDSQMPSQSQTVLDDMLGAPRHGMAAPHATLGLCRDIDRLSSRSVPPLGNWSLAYPPHNLLAREAIASGDYSGTTSPKLASEYSPSISIYSSQSGLMPVSASEILRQRHHSDPQNYINIAPFAPHISTIHPSPCPTTAASIKSQSPPCALQQPPTTAGNLKDWSCFTFMTALVRVSDGHDDHSVSFLDAYFDHVHQVAPVLSKSWIETHMGDVPLYLLHIMMALTQDHACMDPIQAHVHFMFAKEQVYQSIDQGTPFTLITLLFLVLHCLKNKDVPQACNHLVSCINLSHALGLHDPTKEIIWHTSLGTPVGQKSRFMIDSIWFLVYVLDCLFTHTLLGKWRPMTIGDVNVPQLSIPILPTHPFLGQCSRIGPLFNIAKAIVTRGVSRSVVLELLDRWAIDAANIQPLPWPEDGLAFALAIYHLNVFYVFVQDILVGWQESSGQWLVNQALTKSRVAMLRLAGAFVAVDRSRRGTLWFFGDDLLFKVFYNFGVLEIVLAANGVQPPASSDHDRDRIEPAKHYLDALAGTPWHPMLVSHRDGSESGIQILHGLLP
ncbi:hypothetical protein HDU91_002608 [Kappamyces sp. JEL0680]|nr:hypothetical protein HDU91_002608 [Kappamyces sp. JEL0680]